MIMVVRQPSRLRKKPRYGHGRDLGDLADAHRRRDPVLGNADLREEGTRPEEVAISGRASPRNVTMNRTRMLGTARSLRDSRGAKADPAPFAGGVRGKSQAKRRENERGDPGDQERAGQGGFHRRPGLGRSQRLPDPGNETPGLGDRRHLRPVDRDEDERPARRDPADRAPDPDKAEVFLGVLDIGKRDRVGDRHGRHVEEAV